MAHWAGIPAPSSSDRILLFKLGHVADIWLFVPTFATTGEAEGTLLLPLPDDLAPGSYELRLMTPNPDATALLKVIARSEPLTVTRRITLIPVLGAGNSLRFRLVGAEPRTYNVEAAQNLVPADWRVVGTLTVQTGDTPEFSQSITSTDQVRFYRVSK